MLRMFDGSADHSDASGVRIIMVRTASTAAVRASSRHLAITGGAAVVPGHGPRLAAVHYRECGDGVTRGLRPPTAASGSILDHPGLCSVRRHPDAETGCFRLPINFLAETAFQPADVRISELRYDSHAIFPCRHHAGLRAGIKRKAPETHYTEKCPSARDFSLIRK